jgi:N4-gp56 family major capsid protein
MSQTIIGVNDPSAVKRFSAQLFVDMAKEGYYSNRFERKGNDAAVPIQVLTDLESDAGDTITFDLFAQLRNKPVYGDTRIKGTEEALKKFTDSVSVDQVRGGVSAGGRMTRKRVLHDLRLVARKLQSDWWARWNDESTQCYNAGARGVDTGYIEDTDWTGFAGNAFMAPDATHQAYGGSAVSPGTITTSDGFDLAIIDKVVAMAKTIGGDSSQTPRMRPIRINGEDHFIYLMHEFDGYQLRRDTATGSWVDIQKAAAAAEGFNTPLFKGGLGMYNNVILHTHRNVTRFNNYGASSNLPASRNILMGMQAMVKAYGSPGSGLRFDWHEEEDDRGNELVINTSAIVGIKATQFNGLRYGSIAVDVYSPKPY